MGSIQAGQFSNHLLVAGLADKVALWAGGNRSFRGDAEAYRALDYRHQLVILGLECNISHICSTFMAEARLSTDWIMLLF